MKYCMILFGFLIFIIFIKNEINTNPIELIEENHKLDDEILSQVESTEEEIVYEQPILSTLSEEDSTEAGQEQTDVSTDKTPILTTVDDSHTVTHTDEKLTETLTETSTEKNEITIDPKEQESNDIKQLLNRLSNQLQLPNDKLAAYHYTTAMKSPDGSIYVPQNHRLSTRKHLATLLGFAEEIVASKNALAQNSNEESTQEITTSTDISKDASDTSTSDVVLTTEDSLIHNVSEIIAGGLDNENETTNIFDIVTTEIVDENSDFMNRTSTLEIDISTEINLDDNDHTHQLETED